MLYTYFLLLGTSEYSALQNPVAPQTLPSVDGATADCQGIASDLVAFGYPADQVIALCGEKFLRSELVASVKGLSGRVHDGDSVVVVVTGHGGMDEKNDPGQTYWQAYDGNFLPDGDDSGASYTFTGITPNVLEASIRKAVPEGTPVLFLTDTARGGAFNGITLAGPTANDFVGLNDATVAYSPVAGSGQAGLLRTLLRSCLRREIALADDGQVSLLESGTCLAAAADALHVPLVAAVPIKADQSRTLLWYPPKLVVASDLGTIKPPKPTGTVRAVQRWGGLGLGVASAAAGTYTYFQAKQILDTVEARDYQIPPSMVDDVESYDDLTVATYVLWGVGAVGAVSFGTSFIHPSIRLAPAPTGLVVSGTFK